MVDVQQLERRFHEPKEEESREGKVIFPSSKSARVRSENAKGRCGFSSQAFLVTFVLAPANLCVPSYTTLLALYRQQD